MKAALLPRLGERFVIGDAPKPSPLPGEVILKVEACGVCHSDLHMAEGDWPDVAARMAFPAILGHEVVGRVVELGEGVSGPAIGDRVGVGWLYSTCGTCELCAEGHENVCLNRKVTGVAAPGGYAQFMRARATHAIPVPAALSSVEAAPYFCAGVTVYRAVKNAGVQRGQRVAVFGMGGLGHIALQLALDAGAEVTAVEVSDEKLALARSLGAHHLFNSSRPDAAKALSESGGFHVAVVTAPSKPAYDLAFKALRRRGTLAVVGLPKEDLTFFADDLVVQEARIVGTAVGTRDDVRATLALAAAGRLRCHSEGYPLEAVNDIFERMRRGAISGRAVLAL